VPVCDVCGYEDVAAFNFCPECGADATTRTSAQRKVVTVLFCDVVGYTALGESTDAETVRALLARYFERMKAIVELHGGTVEKFIGDAVMAVFGIPVAHEDDALRACRTAVEMREAWDELGVAGYIGIDTGEVVTGTEERLATGDAVNVAARLQQAAQPGDALIGAETLALVGTAVDVEAVAPLPLKGKAEPVPAYRLIAVHETPARRPETRFVGRERELEAIREAWERVLDERCCELVTIVGEAGVGKSRLVAEALGSLDARLVQGRCLPYGEGITYWPVVEILKQLRASPSDETAAMAISSVLGETEVVASAEEIAWASRKLLEEQAPLVAVFDDLQWGEETFLDLLEHITLLSSGASILLLAMARPELAEHRANWPVTLRLEPLAAGDVEALIPERIPGELRAKIARTAGGNPLFVEEMVAMTGEAAGDVAVPPTLQALLAARLDQLDPAERRVLERGAVEGEIFHRGAVQALAPDETQVTPRLAALVRKGLIRPQKPQLVGEDGFRFRHLLIRDAAYAGVSKATRAELHERFAAWLANRGAHLVELEEILGYHLERAWRYRDELGQADDSALAGAARRYLAASGHRALSRQDFGAAVNLLKRAIALIPPDEVDVPLELSFVSALNWRGRARDALRHVRSVVERAARSGDRLGELCARVEEALVQMFVEPEGAVEPLAVLVEQALPLFEAVGDDFALHRAYRARAEVASTRGQMAASVEALEHAVAHAQRAGYPTELLIAWSEVGRFLGPTPLSEVLAWQDAQDAQVRRNPNLRAHRARAMAMLDRFDEARAVVADLRAERAERGGYLLGILSASAAVDVELLSGNPAAAITPGEELCRLYEEGGLLMYLSWAAGMVAEAYYALGRLEDADAWAGRAAKVGASGDPDELWRQVRAKVLARRGEHAEAEQLAGQAVEASDTTDQIDAQGHAYADLAEVLTLAGRREDAAEALEQALIRYERKENLVMAERARQRLAELLSSDAPAERA
jgi:class 3 adenylate cyclase/tetratricopeptide (TPR) repeat protein